jgi:hypothetical protein
VCSSDLTVWWSFISTGALQTIDREGKLSIAPYVRRVAYILEKDPQNPDIMRLMYRYETEKTDLKTLQSATFMPSYELTGNIKSFSIEFIVFEVPPEKKPGKKGEAPPKEAPQPEVKKNSSTVKEWKEEDIWDKYKTLIPAYVHIRGSHVDQARRGEYPFEFIFKVIAYEQYKPKPKPEAESASPMDRLTKFAEQLPGMLGQNGKGKQ